MHHPDLARRRVRPQEVVLDVDVERVPQVACRVVGRDVEHLEVAQVVLDLRALVHDEAELAEDLRDPPDRLVHRVERPAADRAAGRRDVDRLGADALVELAGAQPAAARGERLLDGDPDGIGHGADAGPVLGRQPADPAQRRGQAALLAEHLELERLERGGIGAVRDPRQRLVAERLEVARQVAQAQVHVVLSSRESEALDDCERRGLCRRARSVSFLRALGELRDAGQTWPRRGRRGRRGSCGRSGCRRA